MACKLNVDSCFFDIEKAQVLSELKGDVYMGLPQGCGRLSGNIVRLNKRLYKRETGLEAVACGSH